MLAAIGAAAGYATTNDDVLVATLFGSPVLVVIAFIAVTRLLDASRALGLLGYDGVTAESQRDQV